MIPSSQKKDFVSFLLLTTGILTIFFILLFIPVKEALAGCSSWYGSSGCTPSYCGKTDGCDYNMSSWCCWNNAGRKCDCNEECPDDYWANEYQCNGNTSQQKWVDMYCSGGTWCSTGAAYCYYGTSWQNITNCGASDWTSNYQCSGNVLQRQYMSRGCSGGSCYGPTYPWYTWENCAASGKICSSNQCITDTTPPSFSYFYVSPTSWTNGNPIWYYSATDSGSGMRSTNRYYRFLDGAGQGYTMDTSYQPSLSSGSHRVSVNAYDNAGNARGSGDVYAYVDKTDPSGTFSVNKTSFVPNETITLTLTASDSHSGINVLQAYYKGSWHNQSCGGAFSCTKTWSFSESSFGNYTYTGNIYDVAGNASYSSPSVITISIADAVPPSNPIMSPASRSWANTDASVTVTYSDLSGIGNARYCWTTGLSCDPGTWGLLGYFTNGTAISQNDDGAWTLCTRATDNAGNWSNVHCSGGGAYKVDKTNPNTPTINSPASGSTQSVNFSVSVSGDSDSGGSGIATCYYHVKDEVTGTFTKSWATRTCNSSFTVTVGSGKDCPSVGNCRVYVFSKDNATNTGAYFSRSFNIRTPCLGTIALSLNKDTAYANESVGAVVSGLNNCDGLTIEIIDHETYAYQFSDSCIVSGSGCATTINAPYFGVLPKIDWNIHARIDKNGDNDFTDAGEDSNKEKLSVVYSSILCDIGSGCGYLGFTGSPSNFNNWVGMIGGTPGGTISPPASWFVNPSRLQSSCNQGGIKCQLIGAPSANNGDTCNLVDACMKSGPTAESAFYPYPRNGKWDASQNQCVLCQAGTFFQEKKIMDTTQKCFDVENGYNCLNPPIWTNLTCATAVDNSKCESGCGAPSGCDEKTINVPWTEGSTTYKCDSNCAKVVVDNTPPISIIKETDPNSAVPSSNWFKQSFKVRIEDTDDQGVTGLTCRYSLWACDKGGVVGCLYKKTNISRSCNAWIDISSSDCYKEGVSTCLLEVYAVDSNNNQGTKVKQWYNMDFTGPSISK